MVYLGYVGNGMENVHGGVPSLGLKVVILAAVNRRPLDKLKDFFNPFGSRSGFSYANFPLSPELVETRFPCLSNPSRPPSPTKHTRMYMLSNRFSSSLLRDPRLCLLSNRLSKLTRFFAFMMMGVAGKNEKERRRERGRGKGERVYGRIGELERIRR